MTGLESIINQIAGDGRKEADEILAEARQKVDGIA